MDPLIPHNWANAREIVNTPSHVTTNFELSYSRDSTTYKDAVNKADAHNLRSNPLLKMAFTGMIFAMSGLAITPVGSAVLDLPNFTTLPTGETWRDHDPDDGTIILEDAKDTLQGGAEAIATTWNATHYPFME